MLVSTEVKRYGSESCHAYDREGNPQHSVPYKDKKRKGEMRPTTLRDIKERGWYPSVSAILGVVEKKGLDGWKKRQVAEACLQEVLERGVSNDEEFILQSLERAESNMAKARDLGTEIHGAIERHLAACNELKFYSCLPTVGDHSACAEAAVAALSELGVWGQPFSAERTFASPLGYGGTVDFRAEGVICDFKCVDRLDKKLAYDDRCVQLCAYFVGMSTQDPHFTASLLKVSKLCNIFISTSEPGKYLIHEWSTEEKEHGWEMFKACFELYKIVNRYDPLSVTSS